MRRMAFLFMLCGVLSFAGGMPLAAATPTGQPITSGAHYDRNAVLVQDGRTTWSFFARSQVVCNRLVQPSPPCPDEELYDLYAMTSTNGGATWGAPTLVAANPPSSISFYGRTIGATRTADGTIWLFWASGGNNNDLYYTRKTAHASAFAPVQKLSNVRAFNVSAVAKRNTIHLYIEEDEQPIQGVYARTLDGATQALSAPTLVAEKLSIPKAIIDKRGAFQVAMVNANTGSVFVGSSSDPNGTTGFVLTNPVPPGGTVTNWDPSIAQTADGKYHLFYAPDLGNTPDAQRLATKTASTIAGLATAPEVTLTQQTPAGYWDYWPVAQMLCNRLTLYYTSEAGNPPGTGHIYRLPLEQARGGEGCGDNGDGGEGDE